MNHYPSIPHSSRAPRQSCYGFIKYDGSNLRFEYSHKQGWHKFGTRKLMFDASDVFFGPAIPLFLDKYASDLEAVFKHKDFRGVRSFIVYAEYFGSKSFAGQHEPDDPKDIVLFDVNPHKKGILGPKLFLDYFGHLKIAECIYQGNLNEELIRNVKASNFDHLDFRSQYPIVNEVPEGIVCKGGTGHGLWMAKIKAQAYLTELKARRPVDWERLVQEDFPDE